MNNHYVFSETQVNTDELQQYREESDSVLSFVKEYCELDGSYSAGSTELFNAYEGLLRGMRPETVLAEELRAADHGGVPRCDEGYR